MPTYEYICSKCGLEFERIQPISAKSLEVCPRDLCKLKEWGHGKVKRKISTGGGLLFKGSGFYITDYRSENYKAGAKKETDSAKPDAGKTEVKSAAGKTDAKPAISKTEAKPAPKKEIKS